MKYLSRNKLFALHNLQNLLQLQAGLPGRLRFVREKSMADAAALAALTGLDPEEAANLLDATGGDFEMAVSLHYGDQADADLYWSDDEDVAGKLLEAELERSSKEKAVRLKGKNSA